MTRLFPSANANRIFPDNANRVFPASSSGTPEWIQITTTNQASNVPSDPGSIASSTTFVNGLATVVCAAHTANVPGYQNNVLRWTVDLADYIPNFDHLTEDLLFLIDPLTTPSGNVELMIFAGLVDSETVNGSLQGACFFWGHSSATVDVAGHMLTTSTSFTSAGYAIKQAEALIRFGIDSGVYPSSVLVNSVSDAGTAQNIPNPNAGGDLRIDPATGFITFGVAHRSTNSLSGITATFKVYVARVARPTFPLV